MAKTLLPESAACLFDPQQTFGNPLRTFGHTFASGVLYSEIFLSIRGGSRVPPRVLVVWAKTMRRQKCRGPDLIWYLFCCGHHLHWRNFQWLFLKWEQFIFSNNSLSLHHSKLLKTRVDSSNNQNSTNLLHYASGRAPFCKIKVVKFYLVKNGLAFFIWLTRIPVKNST